MIRILLILITYHLSLVTSVAQRPQYAKLSPLLRQLARAEVAASRANHSSLVTHRSSPTFVTAFMKVTDSQTLADYACRELAHVGQVYIAAIPLSQLPAMSDDPRVLRMEARQGTSVTTDRMATILNAVPVYEGLNLPQAFTGQGVVVGLMDVGFDLTHPTFYSRDTTNYRIRQFWDMLSADTVGSPFYVGRDYVGREALLSLGHSRDALDHTHGTHTLGIAAGSGYDSPYRGMAPEADICLVANAVNTSIAYIDSADYYKYTFATDALGFKYLFDYAKSVGKPCVVSFSEGSTQDFWGYDQLYYEMLDSLTGPGRILVSAAGNNGHLKSWFHKKPGTESLGTFIYNSSPSMIGTLTSPDDFVMRFVSYADKNDTLLVRASDVCAQPDSILTLNDSLSTLHFPLSTLDIEAYPSCYDPAVTCYDFMLTAENNIGGTVPLSLEVVGIDADVQYWRVNGSLTTNKRNPELCAGENVRNILSPASSPGVICVGATSYRDSIQNKDGQWMKYWQAEAGHRTPFSSVGPTFDGRTKPDVMAPGNNIISSYSSFFREATPGSADFNWEVAAFPFNGRTYSWTSNTGTSSSCPAVAGAIALWLQAKPDLTTAEALELIAATSHRPDGSTLKNNEYGYGEIDVYRGLLTLLGIDRIADVSARHTSARITCSGGVLTVSLAEPSAAPFRLRVFSLSGRQVAAHSLPAAQTDYSISLGSLPAGIYAIQLDGVPAVSGSTLIRL